MTFYLNDIGVICSLGSGKTAVCEALLAADGRGMQYTDFYTPGAPLTLGLVGESLPAIPAQLAELDCRNNQLALAALLQIQPAVDASIERFGKHRVAVVMGTSTSGIGDGEQALRQRLREGDFPPAYHYRQQELGGCSDFVARYFDLSGPCYTLSTACSSSANALASARRLLAMDLCDAVVVGGSDSLCEMTVRGFSALEAVSSDRCNPFSANRNGINIGEAAAIFLMSREPGSVALLGYGTSSDAHHISAPAPDGRGALSAMRHALAQADVAPEAVDYINLHGTATLQNDAMESRAVAHQFASIPPLSSTKPLTGHTLGTAGALEAAFCWLVLSDYNSHGLLPPHLWDAQPDPELPALPLVAAGQAPTARPRVCMSNSFAFGGNNTALLLGRCDG